MSFFSNVGNAINDALGNMLGVTETNEQEKKRKFLLKDNLVNISQYSKYLPDKEFNPIHNDNTLYENPYIIPSNVLRSMNTYRYTYKNPIVLQTNIISVKDKNNKITSTPEYKGFVAVPSMFNPLYNVQVLGITENVPLLNDANEVENEGDITSKLKSIDPNITNCTIKELVRLSLHKKSILGNARYRYADFMYCKDLGKVANNHLITLRRFATPIGDNITSFVTTTNESAFETNGDVGRLITWFGTEDNKLENILKYTVKATWKELKSEIQEVQSKEDEAARGIVGTIANTLSTENNVNSAIGMGSNNNVWNKLAAKTINRMYDLKPIRWAGLQYNETGNTENIELMRNYDKNKVYEPLNTIQDTHIYEGKLQMNQDITIKFCYKLRAYDNINPKSAFLDLMGNILAVTYRKGRFWGGSRKIIGPQPNKPVWQNFESFKGDTIEGVRNTFKDILDGKFNFSELVGDITGALSKFKNDSLNLDKIVSTAKNFISSKSFGGILGSIMGNALGRPAMYAFNSLLKGDDVGLWHLTIGNPKNPIASIGNLILEDATIEHSGPLGLDDFPSEITVTVKLKPGRSRDATEISRIYTKGIGSIYMSSAFANYNYYMYPEIAEDIPKPPEKYEYYDVNNPFWIKKYEDAMKTYKSKYGDSNEIQITDSNSIIALTNQVRLKAVQETIDEIA